MSSLPPGLFHGCPVEWFSNHRAFLLWPESDFLWDFRKVLLDQPRGFPGEVIIPRPPPCPKDGPSPTPTAQHSWPLLQPPPQAVVAGPSILAPSSLLFCSSLWAYLSFFFSSHLHRAGPWLLWCELGPMKAGRPTRALRGEGEVQGSLTLSAELQADTCWQWA